MYIWTAMLLEFYFSGSIELLFIKYTFRWGDNMSSQKYIYLSSILRKIQKTDQCHYTYIQIFIPNTTKKIFIYLFFEIKKILFQSVSCYIKVISLFLCAKTKTSWEISKHLWFLFRMDEALETARQHYFSHLA